MPSLLEQLPKIVAEGKREAERIMERLDSNYRIGLQTRELVIPSRDSNWRDMFAKMERASQDLDPAKMSRLIYGDNLLAMTALLAGSESVPSMRGEVDLIYIDPPFDSKADYKRSVSLPGFDVEQKPAAIEQFAYSDMWSDGTASYLAMLIPRLVLMRELLKETGSIVVHIDWHVGPYVKVVLDELFGRQNFVNEIVWRRSFAHNDPGRCGNIHDTLYYYGKGPDRTWNRVLQKPSPDYIEQFFDQYDPVKDDRFNRVPLDAPRHGDGGNLIYEWKGAWPAPGRTWACVKEQMAAYDAAGLIHYPQKMGGEAKTEAIRQRF